MTKRSDRGQPLFVLVRFSRSIRRPTGMKMMSINDTLWQGFRCELVQNLSPKVVLEWAPGVPACRKGSTSFVD